MAVKPTSEVSGERNFAVIWIVSESSIPIQISAKNKRAGELHASRETRRIRHAVSTDNWRAQYKYPNMVKIEQNPDYSACTPVVI